MREDYIDFLFYLAKQEKYPGSRDEFVQKIQTDDSYFKYALYMARNHKDQYKGTDEEFSIAIGRTKPQGTQSEPVATEQPAKIEPTTTEPTKVEPTKVEPQVTETVTAKVEEPVKEPVVENKPAIQVKEVEAPKEEVVKKEMPIGENLVPITDKTEVKAVETPSDKMVVKSENKEDVIPSYKNIDKNIDIAGGIFIDKSNVSDKLDAKELSTKEILEKDLLGKNWYTIELNRNVSSRYPDPPNVNTKNLKSYNQDEDFNVFKPIDIEGKKFYSNYDKKNNKWYIYEEGSNKDNWTEVKAGPIKSMLSSKYLKDGQPIKESRDYSESDYNEIESAKKKLSYSKYLQYLVSNVSNLSSEEKSKVKEILESGDSDKYYRWILYNEDPKIADFWVNALDKFDIKSSYLDDIKKRKDELIQQPQGNIQVKEVTEQPQVEVKDVTKEESDRLKVKLKDIKTVPFEPNKKYKPYGEKGPDVYYYEDYDQYVIKEGDKNIIAKKGSEKYNELDSKIGDSVKRIVENKGKCDPDNNKTSSCSKTQQIAKDFAYYTFDDFNSGYHIGSEGVLIDQLNSLKNMYDRDNGKTLYGYYGDKEDPTWADIFYVDDNLPKDKRFNIYKPYGDDKTLIYDKETGIIFKQLDKKAPDISIRDGKVFNSEREIVQEAFGTNDQRKIYQKYQQENPNEGKTVWYGYEKDRPEYKELKSVIEGMDYKKEKGSKNTFVPLTTTPGMPEWSPIPNKK